MSYPAYAQSYDSREVRLQGRQIDRATNGVAKARSFFAAEKKTWTIVHPALTSAERTALESFYASNMLTTFSFVWNGDGATYTVMFGEQDPVYVPLPGSRWQVTVSLVQA